MEYRNIGIIEYFDFPQYRNTAINSMILEYRNIRILEYLLSEYWNIGILEYENTEYRNIRKSRYFNVRRFLKVGLSDYRCNGISEENIGIF